MPRRLSRASVVRVFLPRSSVSSTGHSSHILIRCSTRRSTIRRVTDFTSSAWGCFRGSPRGRHQRLPGGHRSSNSPTSTTACCASPGAVGILLWWEVGFEDRFQHHFSTHRCCHADSIPQGRDAQRPEFAVGFRYEHSSDGSRSISLLPERKRQFAEPSLHPIRLDIRELLTIHARCALVGAALGIGMNQDVLAADLVVHGVEAIPGFCLRFRVQRLLQFLNTLRS